MNIFHILLLAVNSKKREEKLPYGYSQIDYIQSTGFEVVNTGINGESGIVCELEYQYVDARNDTFVIGATAGSRMHLGIYNDKWMFGCGNGYINTGNKNTDWNVARLVWDATSSLTINGNTTTRATSTWNNNTPIVLFARSIDGYGKSKVKLKYCSLYKNDILIYKAVPCVRNMDGAVGFYDIVGNSFVAIE